MTGQCYFHQNENVSNPYLTCGECGHQYKSAEALIFKDYKEQKRAQRHGFIIETKMLPVEKIYACPLCAHDF